MKRRSLAFHNTLGKDGLSALTKPKYDRLILHQIESMLRKDQRILDLGCGYGRIALPMLRKGFDVRGVDLNKTYIRELRRRLPDAAAKERFVVGDMCDLPFGDYEFDVVLCLWSVFDELLGTEEQVLAVQEMHRVLRQGGVAFIEGHLFEEPTPEQIRRGDVSGADGRIIRHAVGGGEYYQYNHDAGTLTAVLKLAGLTDYSAGPEWFGWRERLIVRIRK